MFSLRHGLLIKAPIGLCFALSTHLAVVERELGMYPVEGRIGGLVTAGDTVRWEGLQLGFANYHVSRIVPHMWDPPYFFQDRMIAGRFRSFEHDHGFIETASGTFLDDCIRFTMPLGWAGDLFGRMVLVPYILGLMRRRFDLLKRTCETDEWRDYLPYAASECTKIPQRRQQRRPNLPGRSPQVEGNRPSYISEISHGVFSK